MLNTCTMFFDVVYFAIIITACYGLILDELKTTHHPHPTTDSMTRTEYLELMNLIRSESQSRAKLGNLVTQMQSENRVATQDLNTYGKSLAETNATYEIRYFQLQSVENEYEQLKHGFDFLNEQQKQLVTNRTDIAVNMKLLEGNLNSLSELIGMETQNITAFANITSHMENDLAVAENKLLRVSNDLNVTRQEFCIFGYEIEITETTAGNLTMTAERIQENLPDILHKVQEFENRTGLLESQQNMTNEQMHKTLDLIFGHSALRACIKTYAETFTGRIPFSDIRMSNGLKNMAPIKNEGIFICEKTGLYFISVFVMTNNHTGSIKIEKNHDVISAGYVSIAAHYTTASATVLTKLSVGDKISISSDRIHVYGYYESCLNILQVK